MAPVRVSVVMNCRNSAKYLREAIDSVYAQTYSDWEIVFFDNQSTDDSAKIARSYDSRLRYVLSDASVSLGEARNRALRECRGEFMAFLDCDDLWLSDKLERQMAAFDKNPSVSFAHSNYLSFFPDGKENLMESETSFVEQPFNKYLEKYPISIATVVMRSSLLKEMKHWFDPELSLVEDYDFFMRALHHGAWVHYDGKPTVRYRVHDSNLSSLKRNEWGAEFEKTYRKFQELIPDFEVRYATGAKKLRGKIAYLQARNRINAGDSHGARRALQEVKFKSPLLFGCYLLTFFPTEVWRGLYGGYIKVKSRF